MKKGLMLTFVAFSVFCLTACDLLNGGKKEEEKSSGQEQQETADSTVYGTGAAMETLRVGFDIPVGEYVAVFKAPDGEEVDAGFVGVYDRSVSATNMLWEDGFQTTSLCELKANQVVKLEHATLQNIESNPSIGALKNGTFKVGTQFKTKNGGFKVKCLSSTSTIAGQAIFYERLTDSGFYTGDAFPAVNNLSAEEEISFANVPDGIYVMLNGAEIVL